MISFAIKINERLFDGKGGLMLASQTPEVSLPTAESSSRSTTELSYLIGDSAISYYPSSPYDVYLDVTAELDAIRSGNDHELSISGYPLAAVTMRTEEVQFRRLHQDRLLGICAIVDVESALTEAQRYMIERLPA